MAQTLLPPIVLLLTLTSTTLAQAPTPSPSGPANITGILSKAGQFTMLIRLLKATQVGDQINTQLNNSNQGLTLFAPPDNAFSNLKAGTLNSLSDQEKVELIQYHVLPTVIPLSQFQTVSNPLRTQAGNANNGQFPLNVTTSGTQVNLTTGVVDATVADTIYSDSQLAVYQVDKVLLPLDLFGTATPAPAPKPEKGASTADKPSKSGGDDNADTSEAMGLTRHGVVAFGIGAIVVAFCL